MISLDTNILFSVLNPHDSNHKKARQLLTRHGALEALVLCPVVMTELLASPDGVAIRDFLDRSQIGVVWEMPQSVWEEAGRALGGYAALRRAGQLPRRIAADFLIAAHAQHHGLSVMSLDDTVYASVFPNVRLIG